MAFTLKLPAALRKAGWKVKIRDKERREPPHVTILRRTDAWRVNLRTGNFMDASPDPSAVPDEVVNHMRSHWERLCRKWDEMYPDNPMKNDD